MELSAVKFYPALKSIHTPAKKHHFDNLNIAIHVYW